MAQRDEKPIKTISLLGGGKKKRGAIVIYIGARKGPSHLNLDKIRLNEDVKGKRERNLRDITVVAKMTNR